MIHIVPKNIYYPPTHVGFIAGNLDGIVTINGVPSSRPIYLYEVMSGGIGLLNFVARQASLANGHYLFMGLNPSKKYLIMCRDHEQQYEPCVYDHVQPATDLTLAQQQELWQSWQS